MSDGKISDPERRLRTIFSKSRSIGYQREAAASVTKNLESGEGAMADPGEIDGARLRAAVRQLALLGDQLGTKYEGHAGLGRQWEDVALANRLLEAINQEAPLPSIPRINFVAELMVISDGTRPAGLIRGGRLLEPEAMGEFGELYLSFLPSIDRSIEATGRIMIGDRHVGTGFLVEASDAFDRAPAVLTARHVVQVDRQRLSIDFAGEIGGTTNNCFTLGEVLFEGKTAAQTDDYCLFLLGSEIGSATIPAHAELDFRFSSLEPPRQMAVISYPGRPGPETRALVDEAAWNQAFQGIWHVKRLSPASVLQSPRKAIVRHDATTTGGSSGGAIASIGTGKVAALHLGGTAGGYNEGLRVTSVAGSCVR